MSDWEFRKKLGEVTLRAGGTTPVWFSARKRYDWQTQETKPFYMIHFNIDYGGISNRELEDVKIQGKSMSASFHGGNRWKEYLKLKRTFDNVGAVIDFVKHLQNNPIHGIYTFNLDKDIDCIINEFKVSLL